MSWYPSIKVTEQEYKYLKTLQYVFRVQDPRKRWVPYILQPHQIEWHRDDVAIQQENAKTRVVIKSRNTSFTTSALISNLIAVPFFPSQIIPFVRLNMIRANDLLEKECKALIKHIQPVKVGDRLFPFNPEKVDMSSRGRIIFKEYDVEFRAFPATNAAAENIRGLRITGSAGIIDECNFMKDYNNIYIATRDAFSGTIDGKRVFQMNIGTTLRGMTPFKIWLDSIKDKDVGIKIYNWPVFDMKKINFDKPFYEQNIEPIVPWHDVYDLWNKYQENPDKFLEEYCCIVAPDEMALYPLDKVMECVDDKLVNYKYKIDDNPHEIYIGIDPSGEGQDYAAIVIMEKIDDIYVQRGLWYDRKIDLTKFQEYCDNIIQSWNPVKCRIDGNGLGYQMAQALKKKYPKIVEVIRGSFNIKSSKNEEVVPFKEYQHTNLIHLIYQKKIKFLQDEMQYIHFSVWKKNYTCESTKEYGHGDIISAMCLAVLPLNWKQGGAKNDVYTKRLSESKQFDINNIFDRIKYYEKEMKRGRKDYYF